MTDRCARLESEHEALMAHLVAGQEAQVDVAVTRRTAGAHLQGNEERFSSAMGWGEGSSPQLPPPQRLVALNERLIGTTHPPCHYHHNTASRLPPSRQHSLHSLRPWLTSESA